MAKQHEAYRRIAAATTPEERLGMVCACAACERDDQYGPSAASTRAKPKIGRARVIAGPEPRITLS